MTDPTALPAADLLDAYVDALRRAPLTSPGPELDRAVALRAELLRRLTLAERFVRPPLWRQAERDAPPPAGTPEQP